MSLRLLLNISCFKSRLGDLLVKKCWQNGVHSPKCKCDKIARSRRNDEPPTIGSSSHQCMNILRKIFWLECYRLACTGYSETGSTVFLYWTNMVFLWIQYGRIIWPDFAGKAIGKSNQSNRFDLTFMGSEVILF